MKFNYDNWRILFIPIFMGLGLTISYFYIELLDNAYDIEKYYNLGYNFPNIRR